jgi:hypothetical protein
MLEGGQHVMTTFPHLLASFHHLEKLLVAAETLSHRLPRCDDLVDRLLRDAADSQLEGNALGHSGCYERPGGGGLPHPQSYLSLFSFWKLNEGMSCWRRGIVLLDYMKIGSGCFSAEKAKLPAKETCGFGVVLPESMESHFRKFAHNQQV